MAPSDGGTTVTLPGPIIPPMPIAPPAGLPRRPKVGLYEQNAWAMVLGSEVPSVIVFADGSAIRQRAPVAAGGDPRLVEGRLANVATLLRELERELIALPEKTSVSHATDQPTTSILLETDQGWIRRAVYGIAPGCQAVPHATQPAPAGFLAACRALLDAPTIDEHDYMIEKVEVMLWDYEHSPETPAPWPKTVPPPPAVAPPQKGVVSHAIDGRHLERLRSFLASLGPRQAVAFNDHKWSVEVRVLLPGDAHLTHVNRETWRVYAETLNA